ncbi:MAG: peptidylprolyl isomerase [Candidatus Hydrogenedens sp.]
MFRKLLFVLTSILWISYLPAQAPDLSRMDIVEKSVPDGPVALVFGTPISKEEFLMRYHLELLEYVAGTGQKDVKDEDRIRIAIRCITNLAQREILYQESLKRKYSVTEDEVKKAVDEQIKEIQEDTKKAGKNPPSMEDILKAKGETIESFRERTRKNLILKKMRQALVNENKITVTDDEAKKFYESNPDLFMKPSRVHLKQIFRQPKPNAKTADEKAWQETQKEVEKALARIKAGESFDAVARSVSEAPDRQKGGDMGWIPTEALPPFFTQVLPAMKPGDLSPVIKSSLGWHLFKLLECEAEEKVNFEQVKEKIKNILIEQKTDEKIFEYCKPYLNDSEKVKIFLAFDPILEKLSRQDKTPAVKKSVPAQTTTKPTAPKKNKK